MLRLHHRPPGEGRVGWGVVLIQVVWRHKGSWEVGPRLLLWVHRGLCQKELRFSNNVNFIGATLVLEKKLFLD